MMMMMIATTIIIVIIGYKFIIIHTSVMETHRVK
jgi:hypothetical protein